MKNLKIAAITLALGMLPGLGFGQTGTSSTARIDQRQENQQRRIDQGVQSGELNKKEARRLQKGQDRIQRMEDKAAADGKVTPKERHRIEHAQDKQSTKIRREKHDKQTRK